MGGSVSACLVSRRRLSVTTTDISGSVAHRSYILFPVLFSFQTWQDKDRIDLSDLFLCKLGGYVAHSQSRLSEITSAQPQLNTKTSFSSQITKVQHNFTMPPSPPMDAEDVDEDAQMRDMMGFASFGMQKPGRALSIYSIFLYSITSVS
jgi:hypothetical protein